MKYAEEKIQNSVLIVQNVKSTCMWARALKNFIPLSISFSILSQNTLHEIIFFLELYSLCLYKNLCTFSYYSSTSVIFFASCCILWKMTSKVPIQDCNWRASKASETLSECTNSSWCGICVYIYIYLYLEHSVTEYANLIGPLRESISIRITPFSTLKTLT